MAIAFDVSSIGTLANPATGITVAITPSAGANMAVFASVGAPTTDKLTSIRYDGTDMTEVQSFTNVDGRGIYLYYIPIATGPGTAKNVVVVGASDAWQMALASYTGVAQTSTLDTSNTGVTIGSSVSSIDISITTTTDDCWAIAAGRAGLGFTNGTNTTMRRTANGVGLVDTDASLGTAGAETINVAVTAPTAAGLGAIVAAIKPAGGGGPTANNSARRLFMLTM